LPLPLPLPLPTWFHREGEGLLISACEEDHAKAAACTPTAADKTVGTATNTITMAVPDSFPPELRDFTGPRTVSMTCWVLHA
jgi:hypothetical protein